MTLAPASRVEGRAASLGACAVPDPAATVILLVPAGVPGCCHRALTLTSPVFHRLGACAKNKTEGYLSIFICVFGIVGLTMLKPIMMRDMEDQL